MTYIDHIAPVGATGPRVSRRSAADRHRSAASSLGDGDLACPPVNPFGTTSNHQHPTTPKESG